MKKRILISLPYGMSARNILRSGIYEELRKNFDITVATPLFQDKDFLAEFGHPGVEFYDLPRLFTFPFKIFRYFLDIVEGVYFTQKYDIETLKILANALRREKPLTYWFRKILGLIFTSHEKILEVLRSLQPWFLTNSYHKILLDKTCPDLIWNTHPLALEEISMGFEARKRKIPLVALIHSWDNITAKSGMRSVTSNRPGRMIPVRYDHMIVWNERQKQELIHYYGYQENEISVVGVPQFDLYLTHPFSDRQNFCQKIGADPDKKLILFACGSPFLLPRQDEILRYMVHLVKTNALGKSSQLLVRGHPGTPLHFLEEIGRDSPNVFLQIPSPAYAANRFHSGWQADGGDQAELAETLHHCDVLINVASTLSLDAAVLNRPTICIGFDGNEAIPYYNSIMKHYDFTHYQPVMESGGIRLARSFDDLKSYLKAYLENPSLDEEGRKRLSQAVNPYFNGYSNIRIAKTLNTICFSEQSKTTKGN